MSSLRRVCSWYAFYLLAAVVVLSFAAPGRADPKPLTKEEQAKVDKAIDKGVRYLKRVQDPSGLFPREFRGKVPDNFPFIIGHTLLPALALLECGVAGDDPAIKRVTALLRKSARKLDSTYELSLAIMYLDKVGERQDEETIRSLALRLVAGQSYTGGWTYRCPRLKAEQEADLLKSLRALQESRDAPKQTARGGVKREEAATVLDVPKSLAKLAVFQKPEILFARKEIPGKGHSILFVGDTDNSNTQFAMLGLWAANRHDLPLVPTFRLLVRRFECTQGDDGTWDYLYQFGGRRADRRFYMADTGVGLLALAIGRASLSIEEPLQARQEKQIIRGLAALSRDICDPNGQATLPNYYFLWTIQRVATLYNLRSIGEKDWYRWGAATLVVSQEDEGRWPHVLGDPDNITKSFGHCLNTSFALLFLKRSNLTKDLTAKLPFKPEALNKGIMSLLASPASKDSSSPGSAIPKKD